MDPVVVVLEKPEKRYMVMWARCLFDPPPQYFSPEAQVQGVFATIEEACAAAGTAMAAGHYVGFAVVEVRVLYTLRKYR